MRGGHVPDRGEPIAQFPPEGPSGIERLDDLEVYRYLVVIAAEVQDRASRCWSRTAATTLAAAATVLRRLASGLYRARDRDG
jgi:hypothetical protein